MELNYTMAQNKYKSGDTILVMSQDFSYLENVI